MECTCNVSQRYRQVHEKKKSDSAVYDEQAHSLYKAYTKKYSDYPSQHTSTQCDLSDRMVAPRRKKSRKLTNWRAGTRCCCCCLRPVPPEPVPVPSFPLRQNMVCRSLLLLPHSCPGFLSPFLSLNAIATKSCSTNSVPPPYPSPFPWLRREGGQRV